MISGPIFVISWYLLYKLSPRTYKKWDNISESYYTETRPTASRVIGTFVGGIFVTAGFAAFGIAG